MLDLVTGLLAPPPDASCSRGPLDEIDIEAWQSQIGLVLQDSPLFHGRVRENISGDRALDEALIWECLAAAHA